MSRLAITMFVDACGWDIVEPRPWFLETLSHRKPVQSLFGFSSACIPAILTGSSPNENGHWSSFYYSPSTSPFKVLRALRFLPKSVVDRGRVRRYLSKFIAAAYGFTGYFQIYNLPFEALPLFDYAEKQDIFRPGGINEGKNIFDDLARTGTPYHVSNWRKSEEQNLAALHAEIEEGSIRFAFLYTAKLDALLHERGKGSDRVDSKLAWYQEQAGRVLEHARRRYDEVRFALFSDHGMADVRQVLDLMPRIEAIGLKFGRDYAAVYDSTMLRFWFLKPGAEERIRNELVDSESGRWVTPERLRAYGTWWEDGRFGHAIYALEPGSLLNPSHMGKVAPAGMHGYRPDHPDSDSALLCNFVPETSIRSIHDYYPLMQEMAAWARG